MTKIRESGNVHLQRGTATLVVVMMLFLVMALLAAYANRSLLFEQRIAASYFRASLSQEAAEAAVEWSLAQLNGTALDSSCKPVNTGQRFADKYLQINAADRSIVPKSADVNGIIDCARDTANAGWACNCPAADTARIRSTAAADTQASSFIVRFLPGSRGGTLLLKIMGCTDSVPDKCFVDVNSASVSDAMLGKTNVSALIGLVGAVRTPPAAPLVVKGSIKSPGGGLGLHNTDSRSGGTLAMMGGVWPDKVDERLESIPGTPLTQAMVKSDALTGVAASQVFKMFMGASVGSYQLHPSLRKVTCGSDCTTALQDAYNAGQRILWIDGPMVIGSSTVLGSLNNPVLVIATGDVELPGGFQLNGMLVTLGDLLWNNAAGASSLINGIVMVGGDMETIGGGMDIVYQRSVADQLSNRMGSYVRVPGGWNDAD